MSSGEKKTLLWVLGVGISVVILTAIITPLMTRQCKLLLTVSEITAMEYRTAVVKTEDGVIRRINQGKFKVGDKVCFD